MGYWREDVQLAEESAVALAVVSIQGRQEGWGPGPLLGLVALVELLGLGLGHTQGEAVEKLVGSAHLAVAVVAVVAVAAVVAELAKQHSKESDPVAAAVQVEDQQTAAQHRSNPHDPASAAVQPP